jgi:hypothetical protein
MVWEEIPFNVLRMKDGGAIDNHCPAIGLISTWFELKKLFLLIEVDIFLKIFR